MAGSTIGNKFTITTWGESHGKALGVVVDGCPAVFHCVRKIYRYFWIAENPDFHSSQRLERNPIP